MSTQQGSKRLPENRSDQEMRGEKKTSASRKSMLCSSSLPTGFTQGQGVGKKKKKKDPKGVWRLRWGEPTRESEIDRDRRARFDV